MIKMLTKTKQIPNKTPKSSYLINFVKKTVKNGENIPRKQIINKYKPHCTYFAMKTVKYKHLIDKN